MKQYLGNIEPMEYLFSFIYNWLGIKNRAIVAAYYFSGQKQKNILLRINAESKFEKDFFQEKLLHKTIQRNTVKTTYQSESPSSFNNLFTEKFFENQESDKNEPILIFPFVSVEDGKKDFLFIQFTPNENSKKNSAGKQMQLGILQNNDLISEISIVSNLVYNAQVDFLEQFESFKVLLSHKSEELENAREEIQQIQERLNQEKLKIARGELDSMVEKFGFEYIIENSAIRKIIDTEVDIDVFKRALRKAYLNTLGIYGADEAIRINGENLYFEAPSGMKKSKIEESAKIRKVEIYLDKLEAAAVVVLKEGEKLTSENIGRKCDPILIPAAISDYNRRHQERIRMLMINRPEDWPTIREFRPIINILTGTTPPEENRIVPGQNL